MALTYVALASVTVGSGGAANIEFTNIPQTYTDLKLVLSARTTLNSSNYDQLRLQFNGSTASNYSARLLYGLGTGSGASVSSGTQSSIYYIAYAVGATATSNTFGNAEIYIPNYTSSNAKSVSSDITTENNGTDALAGLNAGLWSLTNAITSITLFSANSGSTFAQHSTATLYGIKNTV